MILVPPVQVWCWRSEWRCVLQRRRRARQLPEKPGAMRPCTQLTKAEIQMLAAHLVVVRSSVCTEVARDPQERLKKEATQGTAPKEASVAEYIAKLRDNRLGGDLPTVTVDTVTEFEAAALALEQFRQRGVAFDGETGLEMLEGNVTASKPVPVKEILSWLRNKPEGQAIVQRDRLEALLEYVRR